ncbi:MAG: hypothetical protein IJY58_00310 [Alphaproteobacteria bacterium]|nr:hypothetical protein [Alphaproteobacteria bacterium]
MKCLSYEKTAHFILLCIYTLCPPFYMAVLTYFLNIYRHNSTFLLSEIIPVFWGTIWIPACFALGINFVLRLSQKITQPNQKRKDYPLLFIFIYAVYFMVLGQFVAGYDCLYAGISGVVLVLFVRLFRKAQERCVEYLPVGERVYFYMIAFLFPILVLIVSDVVSYMKHMPFYMSVLFAPIAYIGGVLAFLGACFYMRCYCLLTHTSLKKHVLTLSQAILILLIGCNLMFMTSIIFFGNIDFLICLIMSLLLYAVEYLHESNRLLYKKKVI